MEALNTKSAREVKKVASSMAIEEMFLSEEFLKKMLKVASGEISSNEVRNEVIRRWAK